MAIVFFIWIKKPKRYCVTQNVSAIMLLFSGTYTPSQKKFKLSLQYVTDCFKINSWYRSEEI